MSDRASRNEECRSKSLPLQLLPRYCIAVNIILCCLDGYHLWVTNYRQGGFINSFLVCNSHQNHSYLSPSGTATDKETQNARAISACLPNPNPTYPNPNPTYHNNHCDKLFQALGVACNIPTYAWFSFSSQHITHHQATKPHRIKSTKPTSNKE